MPDDDPLRIAYEDHDGVGRLIDTVRYCLEGIALSFDGWEDPTRRGPGAYLAVVAGRSVADFADPMGDNRWPGVASRDVLADPDGFYDALSEIATTHDGAVVVSVDGVVQPQLVRFHDLPGSDGYADWMGSRHMSALDTSRREPVVATLTLSQESGRVTAFKNGAYEAIPHEEFGDRWRSGSE